MLHCRDSRARGSLHARRALLLGALVGTFVTWAPGTAPAAEQGPPGKAGQICGGLVGAPCADGLFCEFPAGECDTQDMAGRCVTVPDACTKEWEPVCACASEANGPKTMGNDCERQASLLQKSHDGECSAAKP